MRIEYLGVMTCGVNIVSFGEGGDDYYRTFYAKDSGYYAFKGDFTNERNWCCISAPQEPQSDSLEGSVELMVDMEDGTSLFYLEEGGEYTYRSAYRQPLFL